MSEDVPDWIQARYERGEPLHPDWVKRIEAQRDEERRIAFVSCVPFRAPSPALLELLEWVQRWHEEHYGKVVAELREVTTAGCSPTERRPLPFERAVGGGGRTEAS